MATFYSDYYSDDITQLKRGYLADARFSGVPCRQLVGRVGMNSPVTTRVTADTGQNPVTGDILALVRVRSDWAINYGASGMSQNAWAGGGSLAVTTSLGLWRCDNNGIPTSEVDKGCFIYQDTDLSAYRYDWPRDTDANTLNAAELQRPIYELPFSNPVGTPLSATKIEDLVICYYFDLITDVTSGPIIECEITYTEPG